MNLGTMESDPCKPPIWTGALGDFRDTWKALTLTEYAGEKELYPLPQTDYATLDVSIATNAPSQHTILVVPLEISYEEGQHQTATTPMA